MAVWLHQLLYANAMASVLIALVCVLRRFGRRALGSRFLYACWLLVALRLLLPVTMSVPVRMPEAIARTLRMVSGQAPEVSIHQASHVSVGVNTDPKPLSPAAVLGVVWLAGVIAIGTRMMLRNARFRKSLHMRRPTKDEKEALASCMARHGLRLPHAHISAHILSPCLIGGLYPRLVIPQDMSLYDEAASFALLHEACHARIGDSRWAWLRAALCCLHWFNPAVWIAARLSAIDAELACDMQVMARLDKRDRFSYARTLVDAAQHQTLSMLGICFAGGHLQARITQILEVRKVKKAWMVALAAVMVIIFGVSFAVSETAQHDEYDWWIPAKSKEGATFLRPVKEGSSEYRQVPISKAGAASQGALIVTRISPSACNVVLNGENGKMYRCDLIIDPQTLAGQMGYIFTANAQGLTVYETPDADGRVAMVLYGDYAKVEIEQYGENWCRIKLGQNAGYVRTEYLGIGFPDTGDDTGWFY